jgi:hypothetical protein
MSAAHSSDELIPSVAYLRKSTKGERTGRQKQEKSIAQQREGILKLARGRFEILAWFKANAAKRRAGDLRRAKDEAARLSAADLEKLRRWIDARLIA